MALIEIKNLEKTYISDSVETPVLRGITASVEQGEFISIMGPSGSGKSTLLHILGFLDRQTKGEYYFEGRAMRDYTEENLARVRNERMGFVFQMFNLLSKTTVIDNVKLPLLYSRVPQEEWDARAKSAIKDVGLSHRIDHIPSKLSGGEQQRVAIARALVNNPSVIFADEPTGNLDSTSSRSIMEILERLNTDNRHTIILVTHETYIAEYSRRILRFKDGVIEEDVRTHGRSGLDNFTK